MGQEIAIGCGCGNIGGRLEDAVPDAVQRVSCYCADCQAFAHHLGRAELLDEHGGSDIVQVAPANLAYTRGTEQIAALRLAPKGLLRWYATCCKTPLGNMVSPSVPFVGIMPELLGDPSTADALFGPIRGRIQGSAAVGGAPPGSDRIQLRLLASIARRLFSWKLAGKSWPHPFYADRATTPRYPVNVLTSAEREALRPLCRPRPAVGARA